MWSDVVLEIDSVLVRAALICVACDIPAACKFVGHSAIKAIKGCSKCLKSFSREHFGEKADFSGFDRESHRCFAEKHVAAKTQAAETVIEREHGCRYSCLLELPYFDPVAMCVIDPMHNLLLGTAKHMVRI